MNDLLDGAARGDLRGAIAQIEGAPNNPRHALAVVMASEGYPGAPRTGDAIDGLAEAEKRGALVFHAGTRAGERGAIVTAGGRVLTVGGVAPSLEEAARVAYAGAAAIHWRGEQHRTNGHRALARPRREG